MLLKLKGAERQGKGYSTKTTFSHPNFASVVEIGVLRQ